MFEIRCFIYRTYYYDKKPGDLIPELKKLYSGNGWTLDNTFIDDGTNVENGYELLFSQKGKDGSYTYIRVFVDPLDTGSNVGEGKTTQEADEMDSYIFYLIMAS